MKVQNKLVSIKIGKKEKVFTNLILNSYLNLFADSFLSFKDKDLEYCLVNFTKTNTIDETSTTMQYDLSLEGAFQDIIEELSDSKIVNKYTYKDEFLGEQARWSDFEGLTIKELGFAKRDEQTGEYTLYAYLNVENYNIVVQDSQPIVISRIDEVETDMMFYSNNDIIKAPYHLTMRGLLEYEGLNYIQTIPRLYSIGFANTENKIDKEYLIEDLDISTSNNKITINNDFEAYYNNQPFLNYLVYKFKMIKIEYDVFNKIETDTGMFYHQYKRITKHGILNLSVEYQRGE